jgi:TolB-like protein/DNA-binding winged helix-turn-helix (wHTH) protein/Flp pilus assembly protein TadD
MGPSDATGGAPRRWRFGEFELDRVTGELIRAGERVRLQDKPFELLVALLEARGDLVTRETLHERLWPEVIVDFEGSLNAAVRRLRDALHDSSETPAYVETVPRRGYRLLTPAEPIEIAAPAGTREVDERSARAEATGAALPSSAPHAPATLAHAEPPTRGRFTAGFVAGVTIVGLFAVLLTLVARHDPLPSGQRFTLLVLPFDPLNADSADAYFGEGLTEEMIMQIGRLDPERLGVIARTSARRFADAGHGIRDARSVLGADFVLEGSVRRQAGRVRVSAALVKVHDQTQLWTDSFDRDMKDVLGLQREIAAQIADALTLRLLPAGGHDLAAARPVNPVAFDATLRARHFWNQQTGDGLRRAGAAYREALEADSTYAPAWSGLADTYAAAGNYDFLPPRDVFPLARTAALRSLALDSTRAEAWASLGLIQTVFDWDWPGAERSLKRALELNGNDALAHQRYALLLGVTGRTGEAMAEMRRAKKLDPLSLILNADYGWFLFFERRYDEAVRQLEQTLMLDPHFMVAHDDLAWVYFVKGDYPHYIEHALTALELNGDPPDALADYRAFYEREGWRALRRRNAEGMARDAAKHYVSPYDIALEYAAMGDADSTVVWLERSFERREIDMLALGVDPRIDVVRDRPEFKALVKRVGLPGP